MAQSAARRLEGSHPRETGDVISISDACSFLGVHRNTLYRLIREEELPAFKMSRGGRWRFRRTDLTDWLEDRQGVRRP